MTAPGWASAASPLDMRGLRADRGATDPILVIAAIATTLVLMLGGSFAYADAVHHADDTAAKAELSNVALAEAASVNATGGYVSDPANLTLDGRRNLDIAPSTHLVAGSGCFAAFTSSRSGTWFYITSTTGAAMAVPAVWPTAAPSGFPAGCTWPAARFAV